MRIETIPGASAARFTDDRTGSIQVLWNGFRPLTPLVGLSGDERSAAHGLNVERRKLDLADYERFVGDFVEEGRRSRTLGEHIAHGQLRIPDGTWEPGATLRENEDLSALRQTFVRLTGKGLFEMEQVRARIEARRVPLDVQVEASLGLKASVGGRDFGFETSPTDGSVTGSYGGGGVIEKCKLDEAGNETCVTNIAGATVSSRGLESLELSPGPAYVRSSREAVALGVKLGRKIGIGALSLRAEAKVGVNVQLLDAETVRRALSNEDFWTKKR